jgi:hypothetical protein
MKLPIIFGGSGPEFDMIVENESFQATIDDQSLKRFARQLHTTDGINQDGLAMPLQ